MRMGCFFPCSCRAGHSNVLTHKPQPLHFSVMVTCFLVQVSGWLRSMRQGRLAITTAMPPFLARVCLPALRSSSVMASSS